MPHRPILLALVLLIAACDSTQEQRTSQAEPASKPAAAPAPAPAAGQPSFMPVVTVAPVASAAPAPAGAAVPFTTLEAEAVDNTTNGTVVSLSRMVWPLPPEGEASGHGYVALERAGDFLEFPRVPAANALVIRHCIPDAPEGGGITATLGLYVNGERRQSLELSSRHNWLYGPGKAGENGQSNIPTAFPHVYWDEARCFINGGIKPGDRIRLQKDAGDTAAFYRIDLIDVEMVPEPLPRPAGSLSVADYGAAGVDADVDTKAILACIADAKAQSRTVWMPPGSYLQNATLGLSGVRVQGAGMWHTRLTNTSATDERNKWLMVFTLGGEDSSVADLTIEGRVTNRAGWLHAFCGSGTRWSVRNVWITHTNTAFWAGGEDAVVSGCRVRFTYADGININNGKKGAVRRILVENNHVRGTGDDGIATLCHAVEKGQKPEDRESDRVTIRHNTVVAPWWAACCDLAGGTNHVIEDNYFAGNGLVINLPPAFPMQPQGPAVIRRNVLMQCGSNYADQKRGALWIFPGSTSIDGVVVEDNRIIRPWFKGVDLRGSQSQHIVFRRNLIDHPGGDAFYVGASVNGGGVFEDNTVLGLREDALPIRNQAGATYGISVQGNSWP